MNVRPAAETDTEDLLRLLDEQISFHAELLPSFFRATPASELRIRAVFDDPNAEFLVADDSGTLCGLAQLQFCSAKDLPILVPKVYARIQELVVSHGHRGCGVGTALMEACRTWARGRGAVSLRTSVVFANRQARAFYDRHGFVDLMVNIEAEL